MKLNNKNVCFKKLNRFILIRTVFLSFFLFFLSMINAQANSKGDVNVSLNEKGVALINVLHKIENQADVQFMYNKGVIDIERKVTISVKNEKLSTVLEQLFNELNLDYKIDDKYIYITSKPAEKNSTPEKKKDNDSWIIRGQVIGDDSPAGLPGVNIVKKGTTLGVITDKDGKYQISVGKNDVLLFSYIGYENQEIVITDQILLNIRLSTESSWMEDVVVIGYGTVRKSDLTGSLSSVKSEELTSYPASGVTQALQGRAAGLMIQSNNGAPGGDYKVRIRGGTSINASSDPLYVVDGFPTGTAPPAEDVESIEILKDASATAIYGSRGANGVIMITTKRGVSGETKINFSTSYSMQSPINQLDLLNGQEFAEYINDVEVNSRREPKYENPASFGEGTNWQDVIERQGAIKNYSLSVSGGNDKLKYYGSGIIYDQKGLILNSFYKRYSLTSNVDVKASERISLGMNLFIRRSNTGAVKTQETSTSVKNIGVMGAAFKFEPIQGVYDENNEYTTSTIGDPSDNPYALATERTNNTEEDRTQSNIYVEIDLLKDLKFRSNYGAVISNSRIGKYVPRTLLEGENVNGVAEISFKRKTTIVNENYFTFSKTILNNHNITLVGGYSYESFRYEYGYAGNQSFVNDAGLYWNLIGGSSTIVPQSELENSRLSSFYGRLNYGIDNKYLFTLTNRYDGSSRFSKNKKWAYFPSAAFAWNVDKEAFMQRIEKISTLKLRLSYGVTGNQAIAPYQTLASLTNVTATQQGKLVNAIAPSTIANNDLTWESTSQVDIGADIGLFAGRITLTTDYYHMVTKDLLFEVNLPEYSGYSTALKNAGEVENSGFEFGINSRNLTGKLKWNTNFNFSNNRNKILKLAESEDILYTSLPGAVLGSENQILREGYSVGMFYGYVYEGVLQEGEEKLIGGEGVGGEKFKDSTPDDKLTADDREIIGNPHPDFIFGFSNNFSYNGFELDILFQGIQGNDIVNMTRYELDGLIGKSNATAAMKRRWTPDNTDTDVPAAKPRPARFSSRWIEDGSFIRLKTVSLSYNFPKKILDLIKLRTAKIYVSAQNLWTLTSYTGVDPEVNFNSSNTTKSNRNLGLDYASYPMAKSLTFGVEVGF